MDSFNSVPLLDFRDYHSNKKNFIVKLLEAFSSLGFVRIKNHKIPLEVLDKSYRSIQNFFELPDHLKREYIVDGGAGQRGYTPFGSEHAKDSSHPDLKEFWHVGRDVEDSHPFREVYHPNLWPDITGFKSNLLDLYFRLDEMSVVILECLGEALGEKEGTFSDMVFEGNSILRAIHYPSLKNYSELPEGQDSLSIRAAAHEDINLITLLIGASDSGLQILDKGKWIDVPSNPSEIVVDVGDMLSRITNKILPSTTHRVVNVKGNRFSRYSIPFFVHPRPDYILTCLDTCVGEGRKFEDINSQDFLMMRLKDIGLTKDS